MRYWPDRDLAGHLVGAADQRQPVAAVQVAVVLAGGCTAPLRIISTASARPVAISAAGSPFGFGRCGRTTVPPCAWQASAQSRQRRLERAAQLGLARAVGAPGMTGCFRPSSVRWPSRCWRFSWRRLDDRAAVARDGRLAGEVLGVGEQAAPLRLEQVDDVQVLGLRLAMAALRSRGSGRGCRR